MSGHTQRERPPSWFVAPCPSPDAQMTLFCFPHAGGDVINYWPWARRLHPRIELRCLALPGKYARAREAPLRSFDAAVAAIETALRPLATRPFALFGHSMGALMSFELARRLTASATPPERLIVSGMKAPRLYEQREASPRTDAEILDFLREMNGTPDELLRSADALQLIIPALRNDLALCADYRYAPDGPLPCPLTVLAGLEDKLHARDVGAWRDEAAGSVDIRWFSGGHMFIRSSSTAVLDAIAGALVPSPAGAAT